MDPGAVAQFLRSCPGLNKQTTGELLGEYDEFFLEVLRRFTDTFDFTGNGHGHGQGRGLCHGKTTQGKSFFQHQSGEKPGIMLSCPC